MKNKKGIEMSFTWLFGIVIGIIILAFAIYAVTKFMSEGDSLQTAKTSKEIGILLNPLETGFETSQTSSFVMPVETRIYASCDNLTRIFGRQLISVEQKSFGKWTETDLQASFPNKYIFSEKGIEGKKFYVFSKPFEFPFKVADLIYMTSSEDNYCFQGMNSDIERELKNLGQGNIFVEEENFLEECILICFDSGNCDVKVNYDGGFVEKNKKRMYFEGDALMFAAIFSNYDNYECELDRLMKRASSLAQIYNDKANLVVISNCNSNLDLLGLKLDFDGFENSNNISRIYINVEEIGDSNRVAECKLW